jgi:hypothetical protein
MKKLITIRNFIALFLFIVMLEEIIYGVKLDEWIIVGCTISMIIVLTTVVLRKENSK